MVRPAGILLLLFPLIAFSAAPQETGEGTAPSGEQPPAQENRAAPAPPDEVGERSAPGALDLDPGDLILEQNIEGGYDLWVRKTAGLGSVMITDATADPEKQVPTYALRNPEYHPVTGDERRRLDGEFLNAQERDRFFLIDSTPEEHSELGRAFHIFIPYVVEYGYPWSREGEFQVLDGTWLNIRTFELPYGDYAGRFRDNPFEIDVVQAPSPPEPEPEEPAENYSPATVEAYEEIAEEGDGTTTYGKGKEDIVRNIRDILRETEGRSIDLVLCLDTTDSMTDDMPHLKESLVPMLEEEVAGFDTFRLGLLLYRDYYESYLTRPYPFARDFSEIQRVLDVIQVYGGRDIPEAVNEALYDGIHQYKWEGETRLLLLVGDAPPHPLPRGSVTKEMVFEEAKRRDIRIHTIILPH
jgi:hypothetical protein